MNRPWKAYSLWGMVELRFFIMRLRVCWGRNGAIREGDYRSGGDVDEWLGTVEKWRDIDIRCYKEKNKWSLLGTSYRATRASACRVGIVSLNFRKLLDIVFVVSGPFIEVFCGCLVRWGCTVKARKRIYYFVGTLISIIWFFLKSKKLKSLENVGS